MVASSEGLGRSMWKSCVGLQKGSEWFGGRKCLAVSELMRRVSEVGTKTGRGTVGHGLMTVQVQRMGCRQLDGQVGGGVFDIVLEGLRGVRRMRYVSGVVCCVGRYPRALVLGGEVRKGRRRMSGHSWSVQADQGGACCEDSGEGLQGCRMQCFGCVYG